MPTIYQLALQHRRDLLANDRAAALAMLSAYRLADQRIQEQLARLQRQMAEAQRRGEPITTAWLFRQDRLLSLQAQVAGQIGGFARMTGQQITTAQAQAVVAASRDAAALIAAQIGAVFNRLPTEALIDLVGFLSDGSPLAALLDTLGTQASTATREALTVGVATGQGPREIARRVRRATGMALVRALAISRTETLRAYRTAALRTYQANSDVVSGWVWLAALTTRTCPVCWAMHGTIHRLDEPFASHVNCRCTPAPIVIGSAFSPRSGVEVFRDLDTTAQEAILGPGKFEAYQDNKISLPDLVGRHNDRRWGPSRYEKALGAVVG